MRLPLALEKSSLIQKYVWLMEEIKVRRDKKKLSMWNLSHSQRIDNNKSRDSSNRNRVIKVSRKPKKTTPGLLDVKD